MAVSLLDSDVGNSSTSTTTCVLPGGAPASGNLLVVQGAYAGADGDISLTGWTIRTHVSYVGQRIVCGYRVADGSETDTFVFTYSGGNVENRMLLTRWGGSWGGSPFDVESGQSVGATATIAHTPTASSSALIVAHIANYQLNSCAPAAGNTELLDAALGAGNTQLWVGYRIEPTTSGAYTMGGTLSGGGFQDAYIRAFSFIEGGGGGATARSQAVIIT